MWVTMLLLSAGAGFHVPVAPAESLWVEITGSGTTVVLVPGLFGSAFGYRHVSETLRASGYRTVVIEPLGIGRSSAPASSDYSLTAQADRIAAVLDELRIANTLIVAHSVGASMALRLSYRRPDLVRGVLSLDGGAAESVTSASFRRALRFAPLLKLVGGRRRLRSVLVEQLTTASGDPGWITPEVIDGYTSGAMARPGEMLRTLQAMSHAREPESLAPRLGSIRAAVMVLIGTAPKSAGLQESELSALVSRLPGLLIERLDGVGHYVHEEAPAAVAAAVVRLDRLPQTADALSTNCCP
jgi:pimeloyl-ACP methyl ester carboxylesterase